MLRYTTVRLGQAVIILIGVSIIVFWLSKLYLGGITYEVCLGCDEEWIRPPDPLWDGRDAWHVQYLTFVANAARGEFGQSLEWEYRKPLEIVLLHFPHTLQLTAVAIGVSVLLGVPIGVMSAAKSGTLLDVISRGISHLGQSIPPFYLSIMLLWVFVGDLEWRPASGESEFSHWALPALAVGWFFMAVVVRLTRSSMIDVLDSNYVKMARINGLPEWRVVWKHGLVNAVLGVLTAFPCLFTIYMINVVVVEWIFQWPGIGQLAMQASFSHDYQVLAALMMFVSALVIGGGLLVDVIRIALDPRVRDGQGEVHPSRGVEMALP